MVDFGFYEAGKYPVFILSESSRPASNQLISDDKQSARESHNNMKVTGRVFPSEEEGISKQQQADTLLLSGASAGDTRLPAYAS